MVLHPLTLGAGSREADPFVAERTPWIRVRSANAGPCCGLVLIACDGVTNELGFAFKAGARRCGEEEEGVVGQYR